MKLALCNEVLREHPFAEQCAIAATLGYDGLELAPFTLREDPQHLSSADARRVREALAAEGLACASLHWLLAAPQGFSITTNDEDVRRRTVEMMTRLVGFAAEVGAGVLVHGSPKQRELPEGGEADARKRAAACFASAGEAAEAAGVVYLIEALSRDETAYVNTIEEAAAIAEEVGCPGLATMIDTAATARDGGDCVSEIDRFLPAGMIRHVHVNDPNRRGPGEGRLSFGPILEALHRHGYEGWVSAEPFVYRPNGLACAARAAGTLCALTGRTLGEAAA